MEDLTAGPSWNAEQHAQGLVTNCRKSCARTFLDNQKQHAQTSNDMQITRMLTTATNAQLPAPIRIENKPGHAIPASIN
jgi:hypothetical protein